MNKQNGHRAVCRFARSSRSRLRRSGRRRLRGISFDFPPAAEHRRLGCSGNEITVAVLPAERENRLASKRKGCSQHLRGGVYSPPGFGRRSERSSRDGTVPPAIPETGRPARRISLAASGSLFGRVYSSLKHHRNAIDISTDASRFTLLQTELSQNLQQLSERARSTTEFIQRLKGMTDKVHVSIRRWRPLYISRRRRAETGRDRRGETRRED